MVGQAVKMPGLHSCVLRHYAAWQSLLASHHQHRTSSTASTAVHQGCLLPSLCPPPSPRRWKCFPTGSMLVPPSCKAWCGRAHSPIGCPGAHCWQVGAVQVHTAAAVRQQRHGWDQGWASALRLGLACVAWPLAAAWFCVAGWLFCICRSAATIDSWRQQWAD
jgi:hypothetical protein